VYRAPAAGVQPFPGRQAAAGVTAVMSKFGKLSAIWFALVAVSVIGRLWQPAYGVTPLAEFFAT
jgi:hypothetical protein